MKELFPEQDDQPNEVDKLTEPQKEKPVTRKRTSVTHRHAELKNIITSVPLDSEKMISVAVLWGGSLWFMKNYLQCQCNSIKKSTSEEKKQTVYFSFRGQSYKQGERTSDRDVPVAFNSAPNNPPKIPLTCVS